MFLSNIFIYYELKQSSRRGRQAPISHTTVRTVQYTAVHGIYLSVKLLNPCFAQYFLALVFVLPSRLDFSERSFSNFCFHSLHRFLGYPHLKNESVRSPHFFIVALENDSGSCIGSCIVLYLTYQ